VYKFLTKPWDDALLREHIQESFRRYESGRTAADAKQAAATIQE
jgi:FixJ family two-component response regulator